MANKKRQKAQPNYKKYLLIAWSIFFLLILTVVGFITAIINGVFGELPSTTKLENPDVPLASVVYSADSVKLGKYFDENRTNITYQEISPNLVNSLIAIEDARFYQHAGIDLKSLFRVGIKTILMGREKAGGGSTITQQLAKNLFPREHFSNPVEIVIRKLKEWVIAVRLERYYTKREILTMYFNTVDFGSNAHGIQAATYTFFNKPPDAVKVEEAATLVGLLKATNYYSPVYNPENSKQRRNVVLNQMERMGFISAKACDSLVQKGINLNYNVESHNEGQARYFRAHLRQRLDEWCEKNGYDLYTDGLKIHTTINSKMQKHAKKASKSHLGNLQQTFYDHWEGYGPPWGKQTQILDQGMKQSDRYRKLKAKGVSEDSIKKIFQKPTDMTVFSYEGEKDTVMTPWDSVKYYQYFLHPGFMAMNPENGHIKAWVGGVNFKYFKYDHVNPSAKRQVGSTFKPFVYTVAAMNGYSPCFQIPNVPVVFEEYDNWSPKNASREYGGKYPMKYGLSNSINCITAYLIKQVGPESVVQLANRMGIRSKIEAYPSIALGTSDVSVFEMVSAFNTYANKGVWIEPTYITRIEDKNGNVLKRFVPKTIEVLDKTTNYIMLDMLKNVVNEGTARRLRYDHNLSNEIAAKTGTTQNQSDGWFLGAVPNLTAGVWVGAQNRSVHFRNITLGQGANMALPIWAKFMKSCYDDPQLNISKEPFEKIEEELPVVIDCSDYEQGEGSQGDLNF